MADAPPRRGHHHGRPTCYRPCHRHLHRADPRTGDTLAAFAKAGIPVRERRLEGQDAADFTAAHGDTFNVQPDYGDGWDGYDPERITDTVMQTAVLSPGQAADQIAYLRDQGLPESSGSDNRSTGDEPSSLFEGSNNELEDAAPSNTDNANQPTKVEEAAEAVGMDDSGDLSTGSRAVELTDCDETREEGQQPASLNHARDDRPGAEGDGTQ